MKFTVEFEKMPGVGVLFGYEKCKGIIIMMPFLCMSIRKVKKKKLKDYIKPERNLNYL